MAIWEGLQKAFLNEKSWIIGLDGHLEELRKRLFPEGKPVAGMELLALVHGPRVVGVSALYPVAGEGPHLFPESRLITNTSGADWVPQRRSYHLAGT